MRQERGTESKGFVSQDEGVGIFLNRELIVVDLCYRNHSDSTVENRWKRSKTRAESL